MKILKHYIVRERNFHHWAEITPDKIDALYLNMIYEAADYTGARLSWDCQTKIFTNLDTEETLNPRLIRKSPKEEQWARISWFCRKETYKLPKGYRL
jgi:hypothetical protein